MLKMLARGAVTAKRKSFFSNDELEFQPSRTVRKSTLSVLAREQSGKLLQPDLFPNAGFEISILAELLRQLERKIPETIEVRGDLPLLIVLGEFLPLENQLWAIQTEKAWKSSHPENLLDQHSDFTDPGFRSPHLPYLLIDIELGKVTKGLDRNEAYAKVRESDRLGLNIREIISLSLHANLFDQNERYFGVLESTVIRNPYSVLRSESPAFLYKDPVNHLNIFGGGGYWKRPIMIEGDEHILYNLLLEVRWPSCARRILLFE